ncbi:unnamed protein product [Lactuca saligna]|uniref:Ubiquitin-like protease family profile domain-containing protein n=1 Tax=Lactuca saligna TaxID=75948 RepID=A0AA35Y7T8_LACSI|nr:unnamed protein product [Lactuca saligna]
MAGVTELMLSFYVRYVNWTLNHEESPRQEHSQIVYCKKKKDEPNTHFVEEGVEEEEEEEEEEMINEDEEEAYYHGKQFEYGGLEGEVGRTPTHGEPSLYLGEHHSETMTPIEHIAIWSSLLMERQPTNARWMIFPYEINLEPGKSFIFRNIANGLGGRPKWKDVDMVLFVINVVGTHWFMVVLHFDTWKVDIYDSARPMDYFSKYLTGGKFTSFGDSVISESDAIEYWNYFPVGHKDKARWILLML